LQPKRQHEFEGLEVTVSANKAVGLKNSDDGVEEIKATPSESNVSGHNVLAEEKIIAEELRQLKALLDDGCITQEEFDTKKKQLLGM